MDHKLYNWITTPLIFGIWIFIAISGIRAYSGLMKTKGFSPFMNKRDIKQVTDLEILDAIGKWKRKIRSLFLIWVITALSFMILSIIIDRTIGFKD